MWVLCPTPEIEPDAEECWFCGINLRTENVRRAVEHVFPQWLLEHLDARKDEFGVVWESAEGAVNETRVLPLGSYVAGRICRDCNNGWMSRLEDVVKPDLIALSEGRHRLSELDKPAAHNLARWAVKTTYAAQSVALGPRLVPREHRRSIAKGNLGGLRVVGRTSPVELGLGVYASQQWYAPTSRKRRPDEAAAEAQAVVGESYKLILIIGRLMVAICHWPDPMWPIAISRQDHVPIWPFDTHWMTYAHSTSSHGVPLDHYVERVDMTVGMVAPHPDSGWICTPTPAAVFREETSPPSD